MTALHYPYHQNQEKNRKCKHRVEYIAKINIWAKESSLGSVESVG